MLQFWDRRESRRGKSKQKMIQYCMFEWTKEKIHADNLYWPEFGSFEDWICQALNLYVNSKQAFNQEESEYAALWLPKGGGEKEGYSLYPLQTKGQAARRD
ncbi:hypothetical protein Nmel_008551 [Mimus melanotis]